MIEVKNLKKSYGKYLALDGVSFSLKEGDVLGFLGPNGAGKSTTMNIITGYISCDEGSVMIDGVDMLEDPAAAKKKIGYLPEIPPLYEEMTVQKYLEFIFELKKVRLPMKKHIDEICSMVNITDVQNRIIKNLSKGYQQRIGLAQALLGDPPVLILDEPTVGLDPKQITDIRKLIRDLGQKHTIILSSHVLSEVQAVCDKIIVINNGRIAAQDFTSALTQTGSATNKLLITAEGKRNSLLSILKKVDGVSKVTDSGETEKGCYEFLIESEKDIRRLIFRAFAKTDYNILVMKPVEKTLEDTYLNIISGKLDTKEDEKNAGDL